MKPLHDLIRDIINRLKVRHTDEGAQQQVAWWLLTAITQKTKAELLASTSISLTKDQQKKLDLWIKKHVDDQMPLQYILGTVPFGSLDILVEPPVLIPRPETEEWVLSLIEQLKKLEHQNISILDIGSGTGCIGLACAKALPKAQIYASDISKKALALSKKNAARNNVENITFIQSNTFAHIGRDTLFDCIVSNPPYISHDEWKELDAAVVNWEDKAALFGGNDGLDIIREIIHEAPLYLKQNIEMAFLGIPQLVIEIGYRQGEQVKALLKKAGFKTIVIKRDLEGRDRIACAG